MHHSTYPGASAFRAVLVRRRRRLGVLARSTRFRLERALAGRGVGVGALLAPPVHLSLRDSRTLNLAFAAPEPDLRAAELLISRGPRRFRVPLAVERDTDGGPLLTATVTLRDALDATYAKRDSPRAPRLTEGVWRLTVVTSGGDGRVRRRGLGLAEGVAPPPGPTAPHAPSPRTGTLMRVVRCRGGRAAVQVTWSRPRAEVVRFVPRGDGITVYGRVVAGTRERDRAAGREALSARAVRRRDGVLAPVELAWDGDGFSFPLPLAAMTGAGPGQWVWDFHVGGLSLGRRLTDVADLPSAYPTPFRLVALPGGRLVRAHPHFTSSGAFAVTCLDITKETS
ncbi:hypothetical protein GCM10010252_17490 [Streptomyces aureoverticillatus]|nr:hypothetical protein GCM10010252_17490 [Streptomyces aureoverticillatus]